jgi:hypothetical protein
MNMHFHLLVKDFKLVAKDKIITLNTLLGF